MLWRSGVAGSLVGAALSGVLVSAGDELSDALVLVGAVESEVVLGWREDSVDGAGAGAWVSCSICWEFWIALALVASAPTVQVLANKRRNNSVNSRVVEGRTRPPKEAMRSHMLS